MAPVLIRSHRPEASSSELLAQIIEDERDGLDRSRQRTILALCASFGRPNVSALILGARAVRAEPTFGECA